ncbi:MAG TPA: hypothetical protein PKE04_04795 [Clostridia bacterium]|nr:hypothetical protein [Clostridia bacterium]
MYRDLDELLDSNHKASQLFQSMPFFVQHKLREMPESIRTLEELSGYANKAVTDGLKLDPYMTMFEDSSNQPIDSMDFTVPKERDR